METAPSVTNPNNKPPKREVSVFEKTASLVETYAKKVMSDQRAAEYWTQLSVMAKQNPLVAQCTPDSIITGMLACIRLGLMPNTPEQLAYLIPYKNKKTGAYELQFQVGYKGLKDLAYRTGVVTMLNGELVFEGDEFDVQLGSERKLIHRPNFSIDRTKFDKVTHVYITARLYTGETAFYVMTKNEIEKIRLDTKERNFGKDSDPWRKWWDQQALKTALKRATKQLPSSTKDNRLALAAQWDSWAISHKLTHVEGDLIEGEEVDPETMAEIRRKRMEAAEIERKAMADAQFTPQVVQPFHEGDESQEAPTDVEPVEQQAAEPADQPTEYAEVSYSEVKQQVALTDTPALTITDPDTGEIVAAVPCDYPGCSEGQLPALAEKCRKKYGKVLCRTHWSMANKGKIQTDQPANEDVDPQEVIDGLNALGAKEEPAS